jgi:very-long-chain enoyl-CoA reductase
VLRQKLSLKGSKAALADDVTLKDAGIEDGAELSVKDLGPQISWKVVFLIEYVSYFIFLFW